VTVQQWRRVFVCAALLSAAAVHSTQVTREPYGITASGAPVEIFTLHNKKGMLVRVLSYGGIITEISVPDRKGVPGNIALSLPSLQSYEARANFSSLLGRYANRIANGGFTLDGVRYDLPSNPQGVSAHGGPTGFSTRVWHAEPYKNGVVLTYVSADGENGYPGKLSVAAKFSLSEDNALRIEYTAQTDRPTVVNSSHHLYFNLAGSGTILNQSLQVLADRYTPVDARRIPTGQIDSVAGTALDLRTPIPMGDRIDSNDAQIQLAHGLDHNFVLNPPPHPGALRLAARMTDPASGRTVEVRTTDPALQVYTGNGFNGSLMDAHGKPLVRGAGVALETQHFPNSPNQPGFPSTVLRPGQVFQSQTEYRFLIVN